jgi:hypothetical protein
MPALMRELEVVRLPAVSKYDSVKSVMIHKGPENGEA